MSTTILKQELGKHGWCSILCQVRQWHIKKKMHYIISVHKIVVRFPDRDRKTNIKEINSTNHSMIKQCDEPIRIASNYLQIHLSSCKKSLKHPGLNGGSNPHLCDAGSAEKTDDHTDWNECVWSSDFFSAAGIAEVRVRILVQPQIFLVFLAAGKQRWKTAMIIFIHYLHLLSLSCVTQAWWVKLKFLIAD